MRAGSKGSNHIPIEKVHREGDQHPPIKAAGGICYLDIILIYFEIFGIEMIWAFDSQRLVGCGDFIA